MTKLLAFNKNNMWGKTHLGSTLTQNGTIELTVSWLMEKKSWLCLYSLLVGIQCSKILSSYHTSIMFESPGVIVRLNYGMIKVSEHI